MARAKRQTKMTEIAVIGEVDDWEKDVVEALLEVPAGGTCIFYIDSAGGSVYGALAVVTLLRQRLIEATAMVLGECSSATILLFAACKRRQVTRQSTFLFHKMRWQSDKRVSTSEARHWAKHFDEMEREIDELQASLFGSASALVREWIEAGQYVNGQQLVEAGLAEMLSL